MDPLQLKLQYDKLAYRQLIIAEGIKDLEAIQRDLQSDTGQSMFWGNVAVMAQIAIIPLNVIINAAEAKAAVTAYQIAVKSIYSQFGESGSRTSKGAKTIINVIREVAVSELKAQGLTYYIPGVNIVAGLAQDSFALWEVAAGVSENSNELRRLSHSMNKNIEKAKRELLKLGVDRSQIHDQMTYVNRIS
ncbi:MAG: hypothetical protein KKG00_03410 [Bacteroidetes bacterium]|nr:hypothetical protein [Bacteroidota bacterium]